MDKTAPIEFDAYSDDYTKYVDDSVRFSGKSAEFFHRVKVERLLEIIARNQTPRSAVVADIGCGTGCLSNLISPHVRSVSGVDVSESSIAKACENVRNGTFAVYDGVSLPFPENSMDVAFASCVMHHVPPERWAHFASEMFRIVRPGGLVAVIEHNPWNPLTRVAVSNCEFDRDAVLLTRARTTTLLRDVGLEIVDQPYILFFPWDLRLCRRLEKSLSFVPLGAQYIVAGRKEV